MTKATPSSKSWLRPTKFIIGLYFFAIILFFFYSFTQVDLGLTMTRASLVTDIQRAFQWIGYFNRPLSAIFYSVLVLLLFIFYGLFLFFAKRNLLSRKTMWVIVFFVTAVLTFSYNAVSYDIFNYIFDAKIVTHYHENPYLKKALDFPHDPMLGFMHWTHRTYPYGPVWLAITIPFSYIGLNFFLPTFFLFKLLAGSAFLGTVFAIQRILREVAPKSEIFGTLFFALNPMILIESLSSAHNDIIMMSLCMISIMFLVKKKYLSAFVLLLLSAGIKYATGFLLPLFIIIYLFDRKKVQINWEQISLIFSFTMILAVIAASLRTTFQPWYLLFVLPIAALASQKYYVFIPSVLLSIAALLNYLPFLYTGNWDPPIPTILFWINMSSIILSMLGVILYHFSTKRSQQRI